MLVRTADIFEYLDLGSKERELGEKIARWAGQRAKGMTHRRDYEALAAIALRFNPKSILEIGTYLGVTSDFFLTLLPDSELVSIAYENPRWRLLGRQYNNSELTKAQIGSEVQPQRRSRFTQLFGDSHQLCPESLVERHGRFDLVFIDGDHSAAGVSMDTDLASKIIKPTGVICWHDANPKKRYLDVRRFLEEELAYSAVATSDDYVGGIAFWSLEIKHSLPQETDDGRTTI